MAVSTSRPRNCRRVSSPAIMRVIHLMAEQAHKARPTQPIFGVSAVSSALTTVNALNTTLGALSGTNVSVNGNTAINVSNSGSNFHSAGTGYNNVEVFNVTGFSLNNGQTLTIYGDATGDAVVFNFTSDAPNPWEHCSHRGINRRPSHFQCRRRQQPHRRAHSGHQQRRRLALFPPIPFSGHLPGPERPGQRDQFQRPGAHLRWRQP